LLLLLASAACFCCLLLLLASAACFCCLLLLPASAACFCCLLLLLAAGCCCWLLLLLILDAAVVTIFVIITFLCKLSSPRYTSSTAIQPSVVLLVFFSRPEHFRKQNLIPSLSSLF
jgi:hypothetical protein